MRKEWTYKTFGEVGSFLRGKSIQKADFVDKGMPCIHYGQIHTTFGISAEKHLSEIPQELYNKSIIASPGDVIIAITSEDLDGSCKSTVWLGDYDVAVSAHAAVFKHNLNPKFIAYYLRSNSFYTEKEKYARGFKVMEIKPTDIARIPIPVPDNDVQRFVVSELDKINELINLKKSQLKDLDSLAESIFYDMFGDTLENEKGWPKKKLGEICSQITDGSHNPPKGLDYSEYPMLSSKNIFFGRYNYESPRYLSKEEFEIENRRTDIKEGDILFTIVGTVGRVCFVKGNFKPFTLQRSVAVLKPKKEFVISQFLVYNLHSMAPLWETESKGVAQKGIYLRQLATIPISVPPIALQQSFEARIEAVELQKKQISSSITDLENMLASRMQYWFD
jgi:type I restriction enzyme S subunit